MSCDPHLERLAGALANKRLSKQVHLYEEEPGQPGKLRSVLPEADTALSPQELDMLKQTPGVFEAYEGLNKLSLDTVEPSLEFHCFFWLGHTNFINRYN